MRRSTSTKLEARRGSAGVARGLAALLALGTAGFGPGCAGGGHELQGPDGGLGGDAAGPRDGRAESPTDGAAPADSATCGGGNTNASGEVQVCEGAADTPSLIDALPPCTLPDVPSCTDARCVPSSLLPAGTDPGDLADCGDGSGGTGKCVPNAFVSTQGRFLLSTCEAIGGLEGRCLSTCVPEVAAQSAVLEQSICPDGWLCTPCTDPITGESTGACTQGCDPGPGAGGGCGDGGAPDAQVMPPAGCCGDLGVCLDAALVPEANRAQLGTDTCAAPKLCVPTTLTDPSAKPVACRAVFGLDAEGRCLPACLPDIAAQADSLEQATCDDGYLCAPCYDPRTGEDTEACRINGDAPSEPPKTFAPCCSSAGLCIPPETATEADRMSLSQEDCAAGLLCAPAGAVADPTGFAFASCTTAPNTIDLFGFTVDIGSKPGACVNKCFIPDDDEFLLQIQSLLGSSDPDNPCTGDNEICAPCENPLDGTDTGACR